MYMNKNNMNLGLHSCNNDVQMPSCVRSPAKPLAYTRGREFSMKPFVRTMLDSTQEAIMIAQSRFYAYTIVFFFSKT